MLIQMLKIQRLKMLLKDDGPTSRVLTEDMLEDHLRHKRDHDSLTSLDALTWQDLELDSVYNKINRTLSSVGEDQLFSHMMHPSHNEETFNKRHNRLTYLDEDAEALAKVRKAMHKLDYFQSFITSDHKIQEVPPMSKKMIFGGIGLGGILMAILLVINIKYIYALVPLVFLGIMIMHYSFSTRYKHKIVTYTYYIKIARAYMDTEAVMAGLYGPTAALHGLAKQLLNSKKALVRTEGLNFLTDFQEIISLNLIRNVKVVDRLHEDHKQELMALMQRVGEIDLIQAMATYKNENTTYCPQLKDQWRHLRVHDQANILVDKPVGNDLLLETAMMITGSNMSGKSTFLRGVGIHLVLGQGLCISQGPLYQGGFFKIMTSISLKDRIQEGKSYFMMEAESIRRMVKNSDPEVNKLYLIDEIFKGTNPIERLAASVEILNDLARNHRVIATTHDIEILKDLEDYKLYYFRHEMKDNKLVYNYDLKSGVSDMSNAVKLMSSIGYPEAMIEKIYDRMTQMTS